MTSSEVHFAIGTKSVFQRKNINRKKQDEHTDGSGERESSITAELFRDEDSEEQAA